MSNVPDLSIITYLKQDDQGRTCPVCQAQLGFVTDGFAKLYKCVHCGYANLIKRNLEGQHTYDLPISLADSRADRYLIKKGWFEMYQPIDEMLFNMLTGQDWTTEDAVKQVIRDLKMDS